MRALALALLLAAGSAPAQVYKWVDADGVTHYGNQPPPSGATAVGERMNVYKPDAPLSEAIDTSRIEQRKKRVEAGKQAPATPASKETRSDDDGAGSAGGPHIVQRPSPTWHSTTNIGYPSANNPGTRAAPQPR